MARRCPAHSASRGGSSRRWRAPGFPGASGPRREISGSAKHGVFYWPVVTASRAFRMASSAAAQWVIGGQGRGIAPGRKVRERGPG